MNKEYNITQLYPEKSFNKHIFHRDQFAHYLRWSHILKYAKINQNILDWGCGDAPLFELFYRNRYKPKQYLGIDIRKKLINNLLFKYQKFDYVDFQCSDLCSTNLIINNNTDWDIIVCFEVIEHISKKNVDVFLNNIKRFMNKNTKLFLSTPVYDEKVGAAKNHIINNLIGEFTYFELKHELSKHFLIESVHGTFASQKDYKFKLDDYQLKFFKKLNEYYDSNLVSVIMAPIINPENCRNCVWRCGLND